MAVRRRRPRRRPRPRPFPWLPTVIVILFVAGLWWSAGALKRQIAGYYETGSHGHRVGPRTARQPQSIHGAARPTTPNAAALRPLISATGALGSLHPPRVAIIIDDCGNNLPKDEQFLALQAP